MTIFKALIDSIIGYDLIIVLFILFNILFISFRLKKTSQKLNGRLRKVVYLPVQNAFKNHEKAKPEQVDVNYLMQLRERETRLYHIYISIANILPLMGILGTVISLMNIETFTADMITANFLTALTSTFWGLTGAIICKVLEGDIVFKVELNQENMNMLINSVLSESEKMNEA